MRALESFLAAWMLVLPISSIVLVPSVKGTTPAYLMSFLSMGLAPLLSKKGRGRYALALLASIAVVVFLNAASQLGLSLSWGIDLSRLALVDPFDDGVVLRTTMFTQSLYLLAAIGAFIFIIVFYRKEKHDRYLTAGITFLAIYGIYEFIFFLIFKQSGDFLSNRTFGHGQEVLSGSRFQVINIAGVAVERLKSLTGEPSMYAFTALPFFIYALHTGRRRIAGLLFVTLLLTFSTTALLGVIVYLLVRLRYYGLKDKMFWIGFPIALVVAAIGGSVLLDIYHKVVLAKVTLSSVSGAIRFTNAFKHLEFFAEAPWMVKLFGLGFGYVRSEDMFSTLLVNNGLAGLLVMTVLFFYPVTRLDNNIRNIGLKAALIVIYITMMVSVSEFSYLSVWLFPGISYSEILSRKKEANENRL